MNPREVRDKCTSNWQKMQRELENLPLPQDIVYLVSNVMTCNQGPTGL